MAMKREASVKRHARRWVSATRPLAIAVAGGFLVTTLSTVPASALAQAALQDGSCVPRSSLITTLAKLHPGGPEPSPASLFEVTTSVTWCQGEDVEIQSAESAGSVIVPTSLAEPMGRAGFTFVMLEAPQATFDDDGVPATVHVTGSFRLAYDTSRLVTAYAIPRLTHDLAPTRSFLLAQFDEGTDPETVAHRFANRVVANKRVQSTIDLSVQSVGDRVVLAARNAGLPTTVQRALRHSFERAARRVFTLSIEAATPFADGVVQGSLSRAGDGPVLPHHIEAALNDNLVSFAESVMPDTTIRLWNPETTIQLGSTGDPAVLESGEQYSIPLRIITRLQET
jgi:hypothetical protein